MSVLENVMESVRGLFDRSHEEERTWTISDCSHETLSPRWNDIEDMGRADRIDRYECTTCGAAFEPERAEELQQKRIERLRESA